MSRALLYALVAAGGVVIGAGAMGVLVWWASGPSRKENDQDRAMRRQHS
jgi:hypothetical protein